MSGLNTRNSLTLNFHSLKNISQSGFNPADENMGTVRTGLLFITGEITPQLVVIQCVHAVKFPQQVWHSF
jgi:hypothetical protein